MAVLAPALPWITAGLGIASFLSQPSPPKQKAPNTAPVIAYDDNGIPTEETTFNSDGSVKDTRTFNDITGRERKIELLKSAGEGNFDQAKVDALQTEVTDFKAKAEAKRIADEKAAADALALKTQKEDLRKTTLDEIAKTDTFNFTPEDTAALRDKIKPTTDAFRANLTNPVMEDYKKVLQLDAETFAKRGTTGSRAETDLKIERQKQLDKVLTQINNDVATFEQNFITNERNTLFDFNNQRRNFLTSFLDQMDKSISLDSLNALNENLIKAQTELTNSQVDFNSTAISRAIADANTKSAAVQAQIDQIGFQQDIANSQFNTGLLVNTTSDIISANQSAELLKKQNQKQASVTPVVPTNPSAQNFNRPFTKAKNPFTASRPGFTQQKLNNSKTFGPQKRVSFN